VIRERYSPLMTASTWGAAWRERAFRTGLFVSLIALVAFTIGLPVFFRHIEAKPGRMPNDPLLAVIGPIDITWVTFTVLYATMALSIGRALRDPWLILRGLHAYALMMILRVIGMELFTLEPPPGIIPLIDPMTSIFYPNGTPFLKDLFFSGHTATLVLMVCISQGRAARIIAITATIIVGSLVLVQHVHWTVDVFAAPVFAWIAWKASALTLRACGRGA